MFGDYENHKERLMSNQLPLADYKTKTVGEADESIKDGKVALKGYKALNIRKTPSLDAPILGVLHDGDVVTIYESESTGTFYKIRTVGGVEGYSLKEQIKMEN